MKTIIAIVVIVLIVIVVLAISKKTVPPEPVSTTPTPTNQLGAISPSLSGSYVINPLSSSAKWTGSKKLIVNYYDSGTIAVKSGRVNVASNTITGGEITFDMNSIAVSKTGKGDGETILTRHLKSADFFDAEKYPEAVYTVTSVAAQPDGSYILKGNLKVKDVIAPLDVPATIDVLRSVDVDPEISELVVSGTVTVNRTLWNVRYGSEKFFGDLGDAVINDNFTLQFEIVAPTVVEQI